jgi:Leucine-rich repeat (LRR) protein
MKKLYLLAALAMSSLGLAQIVNIPDANFKKKLLEASPSNAIAFTTNSTTIKIDANNDGEIQQSEADQVTGLDIHYSGITSLEGISSFKNLNSLQCHENQLTSLDISANNKLNGRIQVINATPLLT